MITIEHINRRIKQHPHGARCIAPIIWLRQYRRVDLTTTRIRLAFASLLFLMLVGCTNSKIVIGPIYNRLDDQMRGEFHKLAKWNEDQIAHFESRVGTFHVWHRQHELPKYAALLNTIQASIRERGTTSAEDVRSWIDSAETFSQNARVCHPVNFSFDLMRTLTDEQVNFIEKRFARERRKNFSKYLDDTPSERREKRVDNVVKWASRIGFDFNNTQKRMLTKTMTQQISMRRQYYALVDVWARDLFIIARKQEATDYEARMNAQINKLWTLLEKAHNKEWQENRELWRGFGIDFVKSLSHDQRIQASNWLKKMSSTINGISKDKPSFNSINDAKLGCMVGQPISG